MAVDSCSMHKLGLIGGEISLTLTAAARPMSAAACHLKWHCCNFRQQRANTLSINYMVECALVQQTHTVNTYVSCRSSLHSNPQHSNTCLLQSTSPEVGCFHGNQAAAFDDGSHEMTPADNAGSSESLRGRMDGRVGGGGAGGFAERNYGERQLFLAENESHNHGTACLAFPAGAVYLAPKQAATGTPWTRWGIAETALSRIRADMIHMPHVDSCVIEKVSSDFCALALRVREMFKRGSRTTICSSLLSTSACVWIHSSSPLCSRHLLYNHLPVTVQPMFSTSTLFQLFDLPSISEHLSCVKDLVASGANCLWLEVTAIHRCCATSSNNQILSLAILTEIEVRLRLLFSRKPCSVGLVGAVWVSVGRWNSNLNVCLLPVG